MQNDINSSTKSPSKARKNRLLAAAASLAIAGAIGFGAVTSGSAPVLADPVKVETVQPTGFADVVEKVSPAVVSVRVQERVEATADSGGRFSMPGLEDLPRDHPMSRFFREFRGERGDRDYHGERGPRGKDRSERMRPVSQGSGFFISEDGYLVTNNHVVEGGASFTVVMDDGAELDAKLVGTDPRTDLAVLKVDGDRKFTYVAFADDSKVRVGDWVVAVGNPFGLGGTVTAGIVSARGRDIGAGPYDDFLQIDAAVNRGNSGGPAFNQSGEVVGINTAIFSPSGGNVGIAFAIPSSTAKEVVDNLITNGAVTRGWLGIQIQPVTKEIGESLGLDGTKGALVADAQADGPGRDAGIKAGDVIIAVNDKEVGSPRELSRMIASYAPKTKVDVTVWRGGAKQQVEVELGQLPGDQASAAQQVPNPSKSDTSLADFGLTVTGADDGNGLVVTDVDPASPAAERGIQAGDVIVAINSTAVTTADEVEKAVADASEAGRNSVLVQISRNDANHFVALPISRG
ncbi:Do family serine endopeptidase [Aerobium aerolatum]|uniref:Probable periplasmic serine endoprotease DegP-like n=1 Tax=Aquamicrobium aerolatum DSM 21857 TaxID=1121003 RepID=A0A1I3JMS8_9HYPH|nr:Do family serine endopeptidase [Aquamicrobium aerolatum]SFI61476.1 serine protease Do [Aquamicrobium aerolatum DSM 21857]